MGGRKCGAFLSSLDRDPHPTCTRCRGKICTKDLTCDFCVGWSSSQWEAFSKKLTYKERKRSRPSCSLPPATKTSPRAGTSLEVLHPETSSSSSPGGQAKERGGGLGMHLVLRPVRLPLLPLDRGPARGVKVCLVARLVRVSALLSLLLLRELERGGLLVRSGHPLSALPPRSPCPAHHCTLCDVVSRERLLRSAPVRDPLVFPDLQIEEQGRIVEPALSQAAPVTGLGVLALAPLPARGRERRRRDSSLSLSSRVRLRRDRSRSSDRYRLRCVCSRSVSRRDHSRSSDRYRSRRDHSRRDRPRSSDRYRSRREHSRSPARQGGRRDRSQSRDPPRCCERYGSCRFFLLTVRGQRKEADEPDVSNGRVGRH